MESLLVLCLSLPLNCKINIMTCSYSTFYFKQERIRTHPEQREKLQPVMWKVREND